MENSIATINQGRPVYFSYARNSSRKPEWEHISDCVDPLLNTLTANGLEYRVDVKDIGMGDKISKFEEEIGWNSEVVVIIFSDKYFRSMHCMYEFVQIKRALETYPEKRLMCIKSGDFNLSDFNYILELEQYWNNQKIEYEKIEYHRLREHSGTEIAAYENGFYLDDIRKLYSFFSAINYSNANSINYNGFVGDIVRYYKTTPKPKLTPKPTKKAAQQPSYTTSQQSSYTVPQPPSYTAQQPYNAYAQPYAAQSPIYIVQPQQTPQVAQNVQSASSKPQQSVVKTTLKVLFTIVAVAMVIVFCIGVMIYLMNRTPVIQSDDISSGPYVDLALPSGTLWASCNIGANAPEEYGDYFAWGETETKSDYDWSNYKYFNGTAVRLTKYCNKSDYGNKGYTDSRTTLERSDDAATANWGSDWCMPTQEQFQELYYECTWTWVSLNGNVGYKVEGTNGNTLFLPAAGYRYGSSLDCDGSRSYYWSSSLDSDDPGRGLYLFFYSENVDPYSWYDRCSGFSVRPVRCK